MSAAGPVLLVLTPALPLALALLALIPSMRARLMRTLPFAALPGLGAALVTPRDEIVRLPDLLLGVGLSINQLDAVFLGFSSLIWALAGVYACRYIAAGEKVGGFAGFWLLTLAGNLGVFIAADLVTFYIAFAFLSLAAFPLVIHDGTPFARRAGRIYIVLAVFGEVCILLALMIAAAASVSPLIEDASAGLASSPWRSLGWLLLVAGFGLKAGLAPLHVWLPLAHPAAPTPASAVLSGAIVTAGAFGMMSFLAPGAHAALWRDALTIAGLGTTYFGIVVGLTQKNPKIILAYSTLSQMGLVVAVIAAGLDGSSTNVANAAATLYATQHGLAKAALFFGVGVIAASGGRARRLLMLAMAVMALAIAGLPLTGGAIAKLAIKAPLGGGTASLLAGLSAIGTTLVMLRFLVVISGIPPSPDPLPDRGLAAPWIAMMIAALVIPWALFPDLAGRSRDYALAPSMMWETLWPVALGMGLMFAAMRYSRHAVPEVPEGDVVVIGEAMATASVHALSRVHWPPLAAIRASFLLAAAWLAERLGDVDETLKRWPVAGSLLVAIAMLISVAIAN